MGAQRTRGCSRHHEQQCQLKGLLLQHAENLACWEGLFFILVEAKLLRKVPTRRMGRYLLVATLLKL